MGDPLKLPFPYRARAHLLRLDAHDVRMAAEKLLAQARWLEKMADELEDHRGSLPIHRTEATAGMTCSTCDGGGCPDCTDDANREADDATPG